jgi:CheY-like chemotaxis protein
MEASLAKVADGLAVTPHEATVRQKKNNRILIVDEDELSLALIRASLETRSYLVDSAFTCDQALDVAAKVQLDLVICDSDVRTDTGVHVHTLIQRVPINADVKLLFTSASQIPDVISRRRNDRNVFFIRKPFEHEAFLELVEYAMWMPHSIRSHIAKMHQQQGLRRPHTVAEEGKIMPAVLMPTPGGSMVTE